MEGPLVAQVDLFHDKSSAGELRRIGRIELMPGGIDIILDPQRHQMNGIVARCQWRIGCGGAERAARRKLSPTFGSVEGFDNEMCQLVAEVLLLGHPGFVS